MLAFDIVRCPCCDSGMLRHLINCIIIIIIIINQYYISTQPGPGHFNLSPTVKPMDVFRTGRQKEENPAIKTLHQLALMKYIFPPLIFLHHCPPCCLERTRSDGVTRCVEREGQVVTNQLNHVHQEGQPLNQYVSSLGLVTGSGFHSEVQTLVRETVLNIRTAASDRDRLSKYSPT